MGDGQQSNKIGFIIQARMRSTRLPGKTLISMPLNNGKPLLQWITDELKQSTFYGEIYVATSVNPENDVLERYCKSNHIVCYRGDEEKVLDRYIKIIKERGYTTVVRLTADNPILDIGLLDNTIAYHLESKNDYTNTEDLPLGMNFEVISGKALTGIENDNLTKADNEHVTLFIKNSPQYIKGVYNIKINTAISKLRLTVDYPSDFLVISTILSFALDNGSLKGIALIEKLYDRYPFIFEANSFNIQKRQFAKTDDELNYAVGLLKDLELNHAANALIKLL